MAYKSLTQQKINELFEYLEGHLYWKIKPSMPVSVGDRAGTITKYGYVSILVNRKPYREHKIIFLMFHGYVPKYIDHMDLDKANNRIENLREATARQNCYNRERRPDNTSGVKGVHLIKEKNLWRARCTVDGKRHLIGDFTDIKDAEKALKLFREKHHGEFANHG